MSIEPQVETCCVCALYRLNGSLADISWHKGGVAHIQNLFLLAAQRGGDMGERKQSRYTQS